MEKRGGTPSVSTIKWPIHWVAQPSTTEQRAARGTKPTGFFALFEM